MAWWICSLDSTAISAGARVGGRTACSRLSIPHSPQPVGPASIRRRPASAAARPGASHRRTSTPRSVSTVSMARTSSTEVMTPSVRLKPTAKSVRSDGVAIITA